jgi:hypothetical protein
VLAGKTGEPIERLKPFSGTRFDTGFAQTDGEQLDFMWDLETALAEAEWTHVHWSAGNGFMRPLRPVSGDIGAQNVEIHLLPASRDELLPAANALISALQAIGIDAKDVGFNIHSTATSTIHVWQGRNARTPGQNPRM